jgi:hypothetical protein
MPGLLRDCFCGGEPQSRPLIRVYILIDFGFKKWSQRDASRTRERVFERISWIVGQNDRVSHTGL